MARIIRGGLRLRPPIYDHERALAAWAERYGLQTLAWQIPPNGGGDGTIALVHDPDTGEEGEIMLPGWLLRRLLHERD